MMSTVSSICSRLRGRILLEVCGSDGDPVQDMAYILEANETGFAEADAHKISMAMTRLQNPVKERFDAITDDLKEVTKAQKAFGKSLDKVGSESLTHHKGRLRERWLIREP